MRALYRSHSIRKSGGSDEELNYGIPMVYSTHSTKIKM
jgi:hypothetical protein